jgi:hypothetical protein
LQAAKDGVDLRSSADATALGTVRNIIRNATKPSQRDPIAPRPQGGAGGGDHGGVSHGDDAPGKGAGDTSAAQDPGASKGDGAHTFDAAPMSELMQKYPQLAKYEKDFEAAAQQMGVQPQLLVAIAMEESTGGTNPNANSNGGGMMQFTDDGAWQQYGNGGDRMNDHDSIWASARYMSDLVNQNGGNLDAALRAYNGPLSQGGNPSYQSDIARMMSGG